MNFDELKDKALDFAGDHEKEVNEGLDKAADLIGDKVGHEDQVDSAVNKIKGFLDKQ
jgi:hypothetical protein